MRLLRLLPILPVIVTGLSVTGAASALGPSAVVCAGAAAAHHASLVVEHGDGSTLRYCVGFDGDQISGQALLDASGVEKGEVQYDSSIGQEVCQIDYEPRQYPSGCWTASSPYWAMYVSRGGGAWTASSRGVSTQSFRDGDAEGFRYEAQSAYLTPPSPAGICPTSTPPPSPRSTRTPLPPPSPPRLPASGAPPPTASAATGTSAPPSALAPRGTPSPSSSRSPEVTASTGATATPPPPSSSPGAAVIAAAAAAAMLVLLAVQLTRGRKRAGGV